MGAGCCINTTKNTNNPVPATHHINSSDATIPLLFHKTPAPENNNNHPRKIVSNSQRTYEASPDIVPALRKDNPIKNGIHLDPIYVPNIATGSSTPAVHFDPPQQTFTNRQPRSKRTSQPSLMILTHQISNLINTFQKHHGTIGNEPTRSNTLNRGPSQTKPIKQTLDINNKENNIPKVNKITENGQQQQENGNQSQHRRQDPKASSSSASAADQHQDNGIKKIESRQITEAEAEQSDNRQASYDSESDINAEGFLNSSKVILDEELVNEQVSKKKMDLLLKSSVVEGNKLSLWDHVDQEKLILDHTIKPCQKGDQVYFATMTSMVIFYEMFKITLPSYRISPQKPNLYQVKLWVNGAKRGILVQSDSQDTSRWSIFRTALKQLYGVSQMPTNPSTEVYHLGGWCPECLSLSEISNKDNLWQRLTENFLQGNILITFGVRDGIKQHFLNVKEIKKEKDQKKLIVISSQTSSQSDITWENLCEQVDKIYINWNPSIYSYSNRFISSWCSKASKVNPFAEIRDTCNSTNPQFLIRIPPHDEDFQIRIFVERHIRQFTSGQKLALKLFEYQGSRVMNPKLAIRNLDSAERELLSDVFIFEKSDETDYFILAVHNQESSQNLPDEICFSILFLSFIEVQITEMPQRQVLLSQTTVATLSPKQVGMGINSPSFLDNIQFALKVPPQSDFQLFVESPSECEFLIMVIQDVNSVQDISRLSFEAVLNDNTSSEVFKEYGFVEKEAKVQSHIVVINCFRLPQPGQIKITANIVSKLYKRDRLIEECFSGVKIEQIYFEPRILKKYPIKWSKDCSGQRKRLKNTTTPIYHPIATFQEFLKNPTVTMRLERGRYQFNLICDDYTKEFNSAVTDPMVDERVIEPPALSLAVFRLSDNEKGYKIILDDVFYVPIGYGFWTEEVLLEEGKYTVVCSRIHQEVAKGTLRVRQL